MFIKKIGIVTLSSAIAFSGVLPVGNALAASVVKSEQVEQGSESQAIVVNVEKDKLIEKARSLFPDKFKLFNDQDFHANFNTYPFGEQSERYGLHFFKEVQNGRQINGNIEFAGKDLTVVSYHFSPVDTSDALFPPKVSKQQAETKAQDFLKKMNLDGQYRLTENDLFYNSSWNRPLTEPVEYQFIFEKLKNGIPIQDQNVNITVLGNGDVTQFYLGRYIENPSYEQSSPNLTKEEALNKAKNQIGVQLQYVLDQNYEREQTSVALAYVPVPSITGVDAQTGQLKIGNKIIDGTLQDHKIKMLAETSSSKTTKPLTKDQVRKMAEELLQPKEENVKLAIEGINEVERDGVTLYSVQYMYHSGSSGSGSSFEVNKETGEITNFHNISRDRYNDGQSDVEPTLSEEDALNKALQYIKQYGYLNLNQFAYPLKSGDSSYQKYNNEYYFHFPRIKDGIIVAGNGISIGVSAEDGELMSLNKNFSTIEHWPDAAKAIDEEQALKALKENMDVILQYVNNENNSYQLLYSLKMKGNAASYFDAIKGTWQKYSYAGGEQERINEITHPWAADELNFMISAKIIEVDNPITFDPDRSVTKGEALNIIYKSLARFYNYHEPLDSHQLATFTNIKPDHPLYEIVERAAQQNIIDSSNDTFNVDDKLTREELAFWFARAVGLQRVAEHSEIYKLDFADLNEINPLYRGHVALSDALGILGKDGNKEFNPLEEVTLAELAVSNVRLAKLANEMNIQFR